MNEDVFDMIDTLHARLQDVRAEVEELACPVPDYVQRLDKIDDQIYALQCELERLPHVDDGDVESIQDDGASGDSQATDADAGHTSDTLQDADTAQEDDQSGDAHVETKSSSSSVTSEGKKEILTDDMKENLADAGRAMGHVLRDSKEVVSELSGTMNEIKDLFSFKPGKKH